jgi:hypothetical protein
MPAATDILRIRRIRATARTCWPALPPRSVAAVPRQLLALQAQDLRAVRLAVRARSAGITAAGVNDALGRREVVIGWLCRGTLHMVEPDDYPWLLGLTGPPQRQANARRLLQEGFPPGRADRAVRLIERALADGPMERGVIGRMLAGRDLDPGGQASSAVPVVSAGQRCGPGGAAARRSCSPVTGWAAARLRELRGADETGRWQSWRGATCAATAHPRLTWRCGRACALGDARAGLPPSAVSCARSARWRC